MTTPADIKQFLCQHLRRKLAKAGIDDPADNLSLTESGLVDSFGLLEIVMAVQDKFGIQVDVSEVDIEAFTTVGGFCRIVSGYATAGSATV
ncbi:MAG: acyl carrier protein [Pirellulales bacterium]|nr:acyl carrier protein [Pirellulales bacterium]